MLLIKETSVKIFIYFCISDYGVLSRRRKAGGVWAILCQDHREAAPVQECHAWARNVENGAKQTDTGNL